MLSCSEFVDWAIPGTAAKLIAQTIRNLLGKSLLTD